MPNCLHLLKGVTPHDILYICKAENVKENAIYGEEKNEERKKKKYFRRFSKFEKIVATNS